MVRLEEQVIESLAADTLSTGLPSGWYSHFKDYFELRIKDPRKHANILFGRS